jgi:putative transposase
MLLYAMAQSLSHLIGHAVFSTKDRRALLRSEEIRSETYSYMAGVLKNLQCHPTKIGGADDHVHILSSLSKNIAFAEMIGRLKGSSSKRFSEKGVLGFAWQNGYGASTDPRPPFQGDSSRGRLPRAEALGCFPFVLRALGIRTSRPY